MLECTSILRCREECRNEDEERLRLDGWAVVRVEEIEKEVHVHLTAEDDSRWRVQK